MAIAAVLIVSFLGLAVWSLPAQRVVIVTLLAMCGHFALAIFAVFFSVLTDSIGAKAGVVLSLLWPALKPFATSILGGGILYAVTAMILLAARRQLSRTWSAPKCVLWEPDSLGALVIFLGLAYVVVPLALVSTVLDQGRREFNVFLGSLKTADRIQLCGWVSPIEPEPVDILDARNKLAISDTFARAVPHVDFRASYRVLIGYRLNDLRQGAITATRGHRTISVRYVSEQFIMPNRFVVIRLEGFRIEALADLIKNERKAYDASKE